MVVNDKLVSIIIPVYKAEKFLIKCVHSILEQDYKNIEIYLIDDGSPDLSPKLCDELASKYSNIFTFHKQNGGASAARNLGLTLLNQNTKYVIFVDSDDYLLPNSIRKLVEKAENDKSDVVLPTKYIKKYYNSDKEKLTSLIPDKFIINEPIKFAIEVMIGEGLAWRSTSVLYSFDLINNFNIRYPEGHTAEDLIFNLEIMKVANRISFLEDPTLVNVKHSSSVTATFKKEFTKTIKFLDEKVIDFIKELNLNNEYVNKKVDNLLYRNIVVYLFSILSTHDLTKNERKEMALDLLNNYELSRGVLQKKCKPTYFNNRIVRYCMSVIYFLLRRKYYKFTIKLLSRFF